MTFMEISVSQGASQGRSFLASAFDLARQRRHSNITTLLVSVSVSDEVLLSLLLDGTLRLFSGCERVSEGIVAALLYA